MECTTTSNPSHGWRSILAGREVLKKGVGWVIGNGERVNVWSDPWLSLTQPLRPIGPPQQHTSHLMVSDLICKETNQWDEAVICRLLPHHLETIKLIPLSSTRQVDKLVWLPLKKGDYTTRSGYGLLTTAEVQPQNLDFNWQANIWKLRTSPKIKSFLWKASVGAIPVASQLFHRGITTDQTCKRCGEVETPVHVLVECPFAQQVWSLAPLNNTPNLRYDSVLGFLQEAKLVKNLPPSGLAVAHLYPWLCWNLWTARNKLLFENNSYSHVEIVTKAVMEARQWQEAQLELPSPRQQATSNPNPEVTLEGALCYTDAAWNQASKRCGLGWHISFGDQQELLASASRSHVNSALAAEAWAIREAISDAKSRGLDALHVHSDSQSLVNLLNAQEGHVEIQAILWDIRDLCDSFRVVSFTFVPRLSNLVADNLAKQALVSYLPDFSGS